MCGTVQHPGAHPAQAARNNSTNNNSTEDRAPLAEACAGYARLNRRRLLRSSAAAAAGVLSGGNWLTGWAEQLARAADETPHQRPRSLLFLWMQGGPSQLETFDPHPGTWIGGDTRGIATTIPDVMLSECLPATAEKLHLTTLIRSLVSKEGDHERAAYHLKTGWRPEPTLVHPSIGAVLCNQSSSNSDLPRHISIMAGQWPARGGFLGPAYDAFQTWDPSEGIPNLRARVDDSTLQQRTRLLQTLESEFQRGRLPQLDRTRTQHQSATRNALRMMSSEQLTAFDVSQEGSSTVGKFGDTPFGRSCLAAIRLLETGVRCVEVELDGWDSHINNHELQYDRGRVLDAALAATLDELERRELLGHTVVFCGGEFGRTPQLNPAAGRDHWPHGFSCLLAGGPFRRGYVHGATAPNPDRSLLDRPSESGSFDPTRCTENIVTVPDLHATLLTALQIDPNQEQMTPIGRPLRWSDGRVIEALLG